MQLLDRLNKQGKTIVLVTHNDEYKKAGNRIIELKNLKNHLA